MPASLAIPVFAVSLAVTLYAAATFARRLERIARRLGFAEAVVGLLTALAADGPEIVSALFALGKSAGAVSLGVLVGSNVFNLAAMIGLSAVLVGSVSLRREALLLEGAVGLFASLLAAALVFGLIPPLGATLLLVAVFGPYVALLVRGRVPRGLRLPRRAVVGLEQALHAGVHAPDSPEPGDRSTWRLAVLIPVDVAAIVAGSFGMVAAALALADTWHAPKALVAVLVLAPLTSLPNAYTAVRLGLAGRGEALVSETLNSNTLNIFAGIVLPALFVSFTHPSTGSKLDLAFLLLMTVVTLGLLGRRRGLGRWGGAGLIGLYAMFVAVEIVAR